MAVINFARREIEAKIVYYGPALSGKTTNVKATHGQLNRADIGKLHILSTEDDRTLFFDYTPITHGEIAGFTAKFKLFSVPGQAFYKETRQVVLGGADAVVFVADSHPERAKANIEALADLGENLKHHGFDIRDFPVVLQINKRDLPNARPVEDILADLNDHNFTYHLATAITGEGVLETLDAITEKAANRVREKLIGQESSITLQAIDKEEAEDDQAVILRHLTEIQKVRGSEEATAKDMRAKGLIDESEFSAFFSEFVDRDTQDGFLGKMEDEEENTDHILPMGPRVDLPMLHLSLKGYSAVRILETNTLPDGRLRLDILCVHQESGERSRLTVNLRSEVNPPAARPAAAPKRPKRPTPAPRQSAPLSAWIFGILGLAAGACVGFLIGMG